METTTHPAPEGPFLLDLFEQWNKSGARYCILRDYHTLPATTNGHDVDLLVAPEDMEKMVHLAVECATRHQGQRLACYRQSAVIARFCGYSQGEWWGVAVDFFPMLAYRGLPYASTEKILATAISWKGIPVAHATHAALGAFLKECLIHGADRKNYLGEVLRVFQGAFTPLKALVTEYFGATGAEEFLRFLDQEDPNRPPLSHLAQRLRRCLWHHQWRTSPWKLLGRRFENLRHRSARIFSPPGIMIAVLGADGSGKSALIEAMRLALAPALHNAIEVHHWRPGLLPSLARLMGGKEPEGAVDNPHGATRSGWFGSLLRVSYYSLDFILGYGINIFPALVRQPKIILFDRYFYDFILDPHRSRVALPGWVVGIFSRMIPKPQVVFCLGADPNLILARKSELSLEEITRQVKNLHHWSTLHKNAYWMDTGQPLMHCRDQALGILITTMAARVERPFRGLAPDPTRGKGSP